MIRTLLVASALVVALLGCSGSPGPEPARPEPQVVAEPQPHEDEAAEPPADDAETVAEGEGMCIVVRGCCRYACSESPGPLPEASCAQRCMEEHFAQHPVCERRDGVCQAVEWRDGPPLTISGG